MAISETDRKYMLLSWRIISEFSLIIAGPVVVFALLGKYLDQRYDSRPIFLVAGFVLAAALSAVTIYRRAKSFTEQYTTIESQRKEGQGRPTDNSKPKE